MYYGKINKTDVGNGEGVRVSLFVSGCRNHCPHCFNKETWDFNYGYLFTKETESEILEALKPSHISGLTLLGGDPFEEENQRGLINFLKKVKETYPQKSIWCYTGYTYDVDLIKGGKKYCEFTNEMLSLINVLIDGLFIEDLKDITLKFRGSSNQRILKLN